MNTELRINHKVANRQPDQRPSAKSFSRELLTRLEQALASSADTMGLVVANGEAYLFRASVLFDFSSPSSQACLQSLSIGQAPLAAATVSSDAAGTVTTIDEIISLSMIRSIETPRAGVLEIRYESARGGATVSLVASEARLMEFLRSVRMAGARLDLGTKRGNESECERS